MRLIEGMGTLNRILNVYGCGRSRGSSSKVNDGGFVGNR
jgi:hypothetical protein